MKKMIIGTIFTLTMLFSYCSSTEKKETKKVEEKKIKEEPIKKVAAIVKKEVPVKTTIKSRKVEIKPTIIKKNDFEISPNGYSISGTNANGSSYGGNVNITQQGKRYYFTMRLKKQQLKGIGYFKNNRFVIKWRGRTFIYRVNSQGNLESSWNGSRETIRAN